MLLKKTNRCVGWLSRPGAAVCGVEKMDQKARLSELRLRSEFERLPIFFATQTGTRRAATAGRLSLVPFFGDDKERDWLSGHTRLTNLCFALIVYVGYKALGQCRTQCLPRIIEKLLFLY